MGQLGNGVYTDGNKGSNFSFELKTLKALEQIAILIEAGGAVPGSQNLQDVTVLGNTTDQGLVVSPSVIVGKPGDNRVEILENRILCQTKEGSYVLNTDIAPGRTQDVADADGVIVMSVNGQTANAQGNVVFDLIIKDQVTLSPGESSIAIINDAVIPGAIIMATYASNGTYASVYPTLLTINLGGGVGLITLIGPQDLTFSYIVNYIIIPATA
jgi:hypothetical protein